MVILYFHPFEAINVKKIMKKELNYSKRLRNYFFRPDRWINTGQSFIDRLDQVIKLTINQNAQFFTLRALSQIE